MLVWRKRASESWLAAHTSELHKIANTRLAIIQTPPRKKLLVEIAGVRPPDLQRLRGFGGSVEKLPPNWLTQFQRGQKAKSLAIGRRLMITSAAGREPSLVIPAGAAFGTGEHATTAMSLRLLEQISRKLPRGWHMLDLGTGSGIFALAARKLGAGKVVAIDFDPIAISTAKGNGRRNRITKVEFHVADARKFRAAGKFEIVTANLFSELLLECLPRIAAALKADGHVILSGVLRAQEHDVRCAILKARFETELVRRRGKWVAILCHLERS